MTDASERRGISQEKGGVRREIPGKGPTEGDSGREVAHEADGGPWDEDLYPESQREPQKDLEQKRDTIMCGL